MTEPGAILCPLCAAGHVEHPHAVGVLALCSDCKREGVVCATWQNGDDYDADLAKKVTVPLETSAYVWPRLTCRECEATYFRAELPVRGRCPACGKTDPVRVGLSGSQSFCNDTCRNDYLGGKRAP